MHHYFQKKGAVPKAAAAEEAAESRQIMGAEILSPPVQSLKGWHREAMDHTLPLPVRVTKAVHWNCMDRTGRLLVSLRIQAADLQDMPCRFRMEMKKIQKKYGTAENPFPAARAV